MSDPKSFGDAARRERWRARAPSEGTFLCTLSEIECPGAKGLTFGEGRERYDMFLIRTKKSTLAYVNACPHAFTTLETFTDKFLTRTKDQIICTTHGALFTLEEGFCTSGPCEGKALEPLPLSIDGDKIFMGKF
ncbi:MAG: Rieske 2Fe-2S domain-containing protein [Parvibaculum sp.]